MTARTAARARPEELAALSAFHKFTAAELTLLLSIMKPRSVPAMAELFREGDPGGTCFVVLRGSIDVCAQIRGRDTRFATMPPGSLFGQVSLIGGEARTATCIAATDVTLLELGRAACEKLFRSRSPTALKLLATLNRGLIAVLRDVDRRLMRLDRVGQIEWERAEEAG